MFLFTKASSDSRLKNSWRRKKIIQRVTIAVILAVGVFAPYKIVVDHHTRALAPQITEAVVARTVSSPFFYNFNNDGIIEETSSIDSSSSPYFWLNSGGRFIIEGGVGKTIQGALSTGSYWQLLYALSSAVDTAQGKYPQNLFRLVTRNNWTNVSQELRFKIAKLNMTDTPNRDSYSGILLFNRYKDENNLYYAGIRMDGSAVIKKKIAGTYYTMATSQVFNADSGYNRDSNPNLIPGNRWMRLKSEVKNVGTSVVVTLWIDKNDSGSWTQILTATDNPGKYSGTAVINGPAKEGIRSDYLDLWLDDYKLTEL